MYIYMCVCARAWVSAHIFVCLCTYVHASLWRLEVTLGTLSKDLVTAPAPVASFCSSVLQRSPLRAMLFFRYRIHYRFYSCIWEKWIHTDTFPGRETGFQVRGFYLCLVFFFIWTSLFLLSTRIKEKSGDSWLSTSPMVPSRAVVGSGVPCVAKAGMDLSACFLHFSQATIISPPLILPVCSFPSWGQDYSTHSSFILRESTEPWADSVGEGSLRTGDSEGWAYRPGCVSGQKIGWDVGGRKYQPSPTFMFDIWL